MASNREELTIFVERYAHFLNLWTIYTDLLLERYIPSVGRENDPQRSAYAAFFDPTSTMMLVLYAYFYSLVEDSIDGINAFRIWREYFPEEDQAIAAIEAQVKPFTKDLRLYRNRLGFHGSRSRAHEASGFKLFANTTGENTWNAMLNFKSLSDALLTKDMAARSENDSELLNCRRRIDAITERAKQQSGS